jgi:hypothetical protein
MSEKIQRATNVGELKIGGLILPCAVLEDGTRVISERGVTLALGGKRGGAHWRRMKENPDGANLPVYLSANNLKPFINSELALALNNRIKYQLPTGGPIAYGLEAGLLPKVCEVWLDAREDDKLWSNQEHIAKAADILLRGLATVGIIALVDEATGYQYDRSRKALEEILDKFISKELRKWAKTFPDDFYMEMFRLRGWQYIPFNVKRPMVVGRLTNDLIYKRLAPGVLGELKKKNPPNKKGRRPAKHFQWLTEDIGHPRLRELIASVITLMKASTSWNQFYRMMARALPQYGKNLELPLEYPEDEQEE